MSLNVGGTDYPIRADYRNILDILSYFNDANYEQDERVLLCVDLFYGDDELNGLDIIPNQYWNEAAEKAVEFIDCGVKDDGHKRPTLMDWEQDANLIIPAVNKALGTEVRSKDFLHWWTFLGGYMEIGESLFSNVISIRSKKEKGKKLEDYEKEFYKDNKHLIDLKAKSSISDEQREELRKMLGYKK